MVVILMSVKLATLGVLTINVFLSPVSNHIINVVMSPKFGDSSISVREVTITSIL